MKTPTRLPFFPLPFALFLLLATLPLHAQQPTITNITRTALQTLSISWTSPTNLHILKTTASLSNPFTYTSDVVSANSILVTNSAPRAFFQIRAVRRANFDPNLEPTVRNEILSKFQPTNQVYDIDLPVITTLSKPSSGIQTTEGLQYVTDLQNLTLYGNSISNVNTLCGLTNLTSLNLYNNQITNVDCFAGLTTITNLNLGRNQISNITALAGLTNLWFLNLSYNSQLADVSSLTNATGLDALFLDNNSISNITAISNMTQLNQLNLAENLFTNISPVAALTNLTFLDLSGNTVGDISILSNLTAITQLTVANASVSNISFLASLTNTYSLVLGYNSITDLTPLTGFLALSWLDVQNNQITDIQPLIDNAAAGGLGFGDQVDITGNTLYFSVDMTITSLGNYHGVSFFDSYSPTRNEHAYYGMTGTAGEPRWGMTDGIGGATTSSPTPQIGVVYRLVGKLDMDASPSPRGWLWLDPSPSDTDAEALLASPGAESLPNVTRIRLQAGGPGAGSYDNLIVGTTWSDVVNYSGGTIRLSHLPPPLFPSSLLHFPSSLLHFPSSLLPSSISTKGNINENTHTLVGGAPACRML